VPAFRVLAEEALSELGVLAAGEAAPAGDADLALRKFNALVDQWAAERLMIYTTTRTTWTLVSGTQEYTVGSGGDVNIARPVYVEGVGYIDTSASPDVEYPLAGPLTDDEWEAIRIKALTSTLPTKAYYNPTFPLATLSLWPIPTSTVLEGVIYAPAAVAEIAAITTVVSLPPGYRRMIIKNLALDLAPSFGVEPGRELVLAAMHSLSVVKRRNFPVKVLEFEHTGQGGRPYDIRTDE